MFRFSKHRVGQAGGPKYVRKLSVPFRVFPCSRSSSGVTLIEMLVVMTLIAMLAAVAAPSVGSGIETVRLRTTAERLAATLRTARGRAIRTRHYMQVSVDPQTRA